MIKQVAIVILQYNNSQDTVRCLNSVKELGYPNFNVIIVDNGSDVNDPEKVQGFMENLTTENWKLKTVNSNLGYSGGNNIGIRKALENGADYIFILNPDTTIEKNALTKLIEAAESDSQIGILGPAIDEGNRAIYGGQIKWLQPELSHLVVEPLSELSGSTTKYYIPGAAMLIKREVIEKIGLLDERYFLYFEDADYCERTKRAGYKLAIVPEALVHHKPSSSTSSLGAPLLLRYHYRNAHLFNWKNGPLWVKFILPFWSSFIIIKQLLKIALIPAKRKISKAILAGVIDFYKNKLGKIEI